MLQRYFFGVLLISAAAGALIAGLLLFEVPLRAKIAARWRRILWIVLAAVLVIPFGLIPKSESGMVKLPALTVTIPKTTSVQTVSAQTEETVSNPEAETAQSSPLPALYSSYASTAVSAPVTAEPVVEKTILPVWEIAFFVWAVGAVLFLFLKTAAYLRFKTMFSKSEPANGETLALSNRLAAEYGVRPAAVVVSDRAPGPLAFGVFRPMIVLPDEGTEGLELILRHELLHLKKRDLWVKALLLFSNALHWFNPLVWMMNEKAAQDIEFACDDETLRGLDTQQRRLYGHTILEAASKTAKNRTVSSLSTYFSGGEKTIKARIQNIFNTAAKRSGVILAAVLIAVSGIVGGFVGCRTNDPSEAEIQVLFDKAETTWSWFTRYNEFPAGDRVFHLDGQDYYNIAVDGVDSEAELETYLKTMFSDEIAEQLMSGCVCPLAEENGTLYFKTGVTVGYSYDLGDRSYSVESRSNDEVVWRMQASYEGYTAEYDYVLEKGADGNWRFTAFELPAILMLRTRAEGAETAAGETAVSDPVLDLVENPVIEPPSGTVEMTGGDPLIALFFGRYADSMTTLRVYDDSDICAGTVENAVMTEYIRWLVAFLRTSSVNWPNYKLTVTETSREQDGNSTTITVEVSESYDNVKTGTRASLSGYDWAFVLETDGDSTMITSARQIPAEFEDGLRLDRLESALEATGLPLDTPVQVHAAGDAVISYYYKNGTLPHKPYYLMSDGEMPENAYTVALPYTDGYQLVCVTPGFSYGITTVGLADKDGKVLFDVNCNGIGVTENGYFILRKSGWYIVVGPDGYEVGRYDDLEFYVLANGIDGCYEATTLNYQPSAPYFAYREYEDGTEAYWLLDENFDPIGDSYDSLILTDTGASATKDGDYYTLDQNGNVTEEKVAGVVKTFFGKYQLTIRYNSWYNGDVSYGLLDENGNTVFEQNYCYIGMPFEDRVVLYTGNMQGEECHTALLADIGGNILNEKYNGITYIVTETGYIGIAQCCGEDVEAPVKDGEKGYWLVDKDGNPVSEKYNQIGNYINESDGLLYINADDTASPLILQSEDGTINTVPLSEVLIHSY